MSNKLYEFINIEMYNKGFLKGYCEGIISFKLEDRESHHEFLYRFDDAENGKNYELQSIDYGYEIPYIEEVWKSIEDELKEYVNSKLNNN